jgi:hypothetical protein
MDNDEGLDRATAAVTSVIFTVISALLAALVVKIRLGAEPGFTQWAQTYGAMLLGFFTLRILFAMWSGVWPIVKHQIESRLDLDLQKRKDAREVARRKAELQ